MSSGGGCISLGRRQRLHKGEGSGNGKGGRTGKEKDGEIGDGDLLVP